MNGFKNPFILLKNLELKNERGNKNDKRKADKMNKVFTVKEYVPGYLGVDSYYITYNLNDMTITVDGRIKKMNEYRYKKALEYLNK